jgi:serine/threonine-protein kinase
MQKLLMTFCVVVAACGGGGGGTGDDNPNDPDARAGDGGSNPGSGLFSDALPWDRDVSGVTPSPESDTIIAALDAAGGWGTADFQMDLSITVLRADASTPRMAFEPTGDFYEPDGDLVPFPVPAGGAIEGEDGYECTNDGDCHLIVVDQDERRLYEMWRANITGGTFYGGATAVWDLDADWDPEYLRGRGCTSADAAGFPIAAMLGTPDEVAAGEIPHALRFILPNARIRDGIYTTPGTHSTGPTSGGPDMPPYAVRFRLRADFDESTLETEGARVIARALKRYGMFLADGGNVPLTLADDRFFDSTWDSVGVDEQSMFGIEVTDFEVVELGTLIDWDADTTCYRTGL